MNIYSFLKLENIFLKLSWVVVPGMTKVWSGKASCRTPRQLSVASPLAAKKSK